MADLSGVLRKTIDGLPRSTPDMRSRVYDKARAAIQRQIQVANPPLGDDVAAARLNALEEAIERTEQHYLNIENGGASLETANEPAAAQTFQREPESVPDEPPQETTPAEDTNAADGESDEHDLTATEEDYQAEVVQDRLEDASLEPSDATTSSQRAEMEHDEGERYDDPDNATHEAVHSSWGAAPGSESEADDERPHAEDAAADRGGTPAPANSNWGSEADQRYDEPASDGPFVGSGSAPVAGAGMAQPDYSRDDMHEDERGTDGDDFSLDRQGSAGDADGGSVSIPEADVSAPAYVPKSQERHGQRSGAILGILSLLVIFGGLGAAAYFYGDDISTAILGDEQPAVATLSPEDGDTPEPSAGDDAGAGTETAAAGDGAAGETEGTTRDYTQRLLPDGTEVDEGPAERQPNQFGEGTDVAAATTAEDPVSEGTSPTLSSEIGRDPEIVGGETAEGTPEADADGENTDVAAVDPGENGNVPVAQRTVFYQERTSDQPGTQETGNVVWSVVEEPPIEGQPPEPAIRAVAEIPEEDVTMTMTIRRNADPTLPASHVIELMFDTPDSFAGGNVATVQRLALKRTEQARGEPLIGVAGKISDGFFIIALNNLDQAVENNLALLEGQQWIDIPIAYASGRRALVSIEKGVPGDRAFKEAIAAWDSRT
ncbi:hypothetical protein FP2506_08391 [Fulvimarina pelagi HTCC2506]|uniref:CheA signal transduction histidine kinase n=1 Tax=Fulvimarina pelagi HTCC2506 TaxID=314231 RepID=Q0G668_9HYPH|nr:hypothetical protein [Fulvimarina pelagi]EAU42846.1 hypothetical protein FP2506_08391 [Fulvimarina pelagi HTCC2506]